MVFDNSFENRFRIELKKENLSGDNIEFKRINNDAFLKLKNAGLEEAFNRSCDRMGIKWYHSNESSR